MVRPGKAIQTFDDWVDFFHGWCDDIGYNRDSLNFFTFEAKYGAMDSEIEFGDYAGDRRWEKVIDRSSSAGLLHNLIEPGGLQWVPIIWYMFS